MPDKRKIVARLIAPCGMNCGTCLAYARPKNPCAGCRESNDSKPDYCVRCTIAGCNALKESGRKYCSDKCGKYPCKRLRQLDKRYRTRYGMSMLENLASIQRHGIRKFVASEKTRWVCEECGEILCVHRNACQKCGAVRG